MAYAFCHPSGYIGVASRLSAVPDGTIVFAKGRVAELEDIVSARARHARDSDALLVPGVPEAETGPQAYQAFCIWQRCAFPDQRHFFIDQKRSAGAA